jgi:hypothetical protein
MTLDILWTSPVDTPSALSVLVPPRWWGETFASWRSAESPMVEAAIQGDPAGACGLLRCTGCGARQEWVLPQAEEGALAGAISDAGIPLLAERAVHAVAVQMAQWAPAHITCPPPEGPIPAATAARYDVLWEALRRSPPGTTVALVGDRTVHRPSRPVWDASTIRALAVPVGYLADLEDEAAGERRSRAVTVRAAARRLGVRVEAVAQTLVLHPEPEEPGGRPAALQTAVVVCSPAGTWWRDSAQVDASWRRTSLAVPTFDGYLCDLAG